MSDSSFAAVSGYKGFLEVIDAEWMADCLSDDELDVPSAADLLLEEDDETGEGVLAGGAGAPANQEDKWNDLGLDSLQPE